MSKIEPEPELGSAGPAPLDLAYLQTEVHALARAKGWYEDRDLSDPDVRESMLALIHSEISEALECVRRGELTAETLGSKPVGLPSELADVVIRTLDYTAAIGMRVPQVFRDQAHALPCDKVSTDATQLGAALNYLHGLVATHQLPALVFNTYNLALSLGIDLDEAIRLKHAYNATRPHRHGGKAL